MKQIYTLSILMLAQLSWTQPKKLWSMIYGGNVSDVCNNVYKYNDTTLIAVGKSSSTNLGVKGVDDYLICQFNPKGNLIKLKTFGGPTSDQANSYCILPSGNLLIGGYTSGKGGDISNWYGLIDSWVLAYDPLANTKIWEKNYGGTNNDLINDIFFLEDGRIFLAGHTKSIDRDVVGVPTKGGNDIFISSIDENGLLIKAFTFGGTKDETAKKILRAESFGGQMLIIGESESSDRDFNGLNNGKKDIFILKINRNINKVFLTNIGGPGDELFADAINLGENGIIIFATVNTVGGQVDSLKGGKDIWIAKVDQNGLFKWSKNIGGKNDETAVKAQLNEKGEIILLANSSSKDQDIMGNYGNTDVIVMKLDTLGNILWEKNYGGTGGENAGALCVTDNDVMYFVAQSFSTNNDLPATNTNPPDFWTVKLVDCGVIEGFYNPQVCLNDTILLVNEKFYFGKDTGTVVMANSASNGCDSIVHISLHFGNENLEFYLDTLCHEATVTINNVIFDNTHKTDTFEFRNQLGCDSFYIVNLEFATALEIVDTVIVDDNGSSTGCIDILVDGGCFPYSYEWNTGATSEDLCNIPAGTYKVSVTDCRFCSREFEFKVGSIVSTDEATAEFPAIKVFDDFLLIQFNTEGSKHLYLYSMSGQRLGFQSSNDKEIKLEKKNLSSGLFLAEMHYNGKIYTFRFSN